MKCWEVFCYFSKPVSISDSSSLQPLFISWPHFLNTGVTLDWVLIFFRVLFSPFWSHTNPRFPLFILSCLLRPQCFLTSLFFFWASDLPFVVLLDKLFKCLSFCYFESIDSKLNCFLCKFNNSSLISLLILMTLNIFLGSQSFLILHSPLFSETIFCHFIVLWYLILLPLFHFPSN